MEFIFAFLAKRNWMKKIAKFDNFGALAKKCHWRLKEKPRPLTPKSDPRKTRSLIVPRFLMAHPPTLSFPKTPFQLITCVQPPTPGKRRKVSSYRRWEVERKRKTLATPRKKIRGTGEEKKCHAEWKENSLVFGYRKLTWIVQYAFFSKIQTWKMKDASFSVYQMLSKILFWPTAREMRFRNYWPILFEGEIRMFDAVIRPKRKIPGNLF